MHLTSGTGERSIGQGLAILIMGVVDELPGDTYQTGTL